MRHSNPLISLWWGWVEVSIRYIFTSATRSALCDRHSSAVNQDPQAYNHADDIFTAVQQVYGCQLNLAAVEAWLCAVPLHKPTRCAGEGIGKSTTETSSCDSNLGQCHSLHSPTGEYSDIIANTGQLSLMYTSFTTTMHCSKYESGREQQNAAFLFF